MARILADQRAVWALSDAELASAFAQNVATHRMLHAQRLELIGEMTARGIPAAQGFAPVVSWLQSALRTPATGASKLAKLAKQIPDLPDVAKAMADGQLSEDQAAMIAAAVNVLPVASRLDAQRFLVTHGTNVSLRELARLAEDAEHYADPEGADERGIAKLEAAEKRGQERRSFTLTPIGDGIVRISGRTDAEGAAIIASALDPLCNPARPTAVQVAAGDVVEELPLPLQDNRSATQRRHDALIDVFRLALATGDLPVNGGEKAQLVVTMAFDALTRAVGAATLDTGERLTPQTARRIACDAGVIPAILDSAGIPLDVGRERRLINGTLRRALVLRDKGCAFPGCDRPPRWCQGHHAVSWLDGGDTSLGNGVLVCGHHHVRHEALVFEGGVRPSRRAVAAVRLKLRAA